MDHSKCEERFEGNNYPLKPPETTEARLRGRGCDRQPYLLEKVVVIKQPKVTREYEPLRGTNARHADEERGATETSDLH